MTFELGILGFIALFFVTSYPNALFEILLIPFFNSTVCFYEMVF